MATFKTFFGYPFSGGTVETGAGLAEGVGELFGRGRAIQGGGNDIITLGARYRYRRKQRDEELREDEEDIADIVTMALQTIYH